MTNFVTSVFPLSCMVVFMDALLTRLDERIAYHATKFVELEARRMALHVIQRQAAERDSALAELRLIESRLESLRKVLR